MHKPISSTKIFSILAVFFIFLGIGCAWDIQNIFQSSQNSIVVRANDLSAPAPFSYATTTITTPTGTIRAEVADTIDKQTLGLSDRSGLAQGSGMLFVFDSAAVQYMWMKDMNFGLDMVWLDQNKKVTYVADDVSADTYKKTPPEVFSSPTPSLYVIELPVGDANRLGISVGSTLSFDLSR